jgi:hypothetical protein
LLCLTEIYNFNNVFQYSSLYSLAASFRFCFNIGQVSRWNIFCLRNIYIYLVQYINSIYMLYIHTAEIYYRCSIVDRKKHMLIFNILIFIDINWKAVLGDNVQKCISKLSDNYPINHDNSTIVFYYTLRNISLLQISDNQVDVGYKIEYIFLCAPQKSNIAYQNCTLCFVG